MQIQLDIKGMSCASCVGRVEKALTSTPGVEQAQVNLATEKALIEMGDRDALPQVIAAIEGAGYQLGRQSASLPIKGMSCASCVGRVEKGLRGLPGVTEVEVNLATEKALVHWLSGATDLSEIKRKVVEIGYQVPEEVPLRPGSAKPDELQRERLVLVISILLTLPLALPMIGEVFGRHMMLSAGWQLLLATPVQFIIGARFYLGAYHALRNRAANMDLLVAMGTTAAYILSLFYMLRLNQPPVEDTQHLYFETSAVIITLVLLGKYFEKRAKLQTTEAIRALEKLRPSTAIKITATGQQQVPVETLRVEDLVLVRPGERMPVDGELVEGITEADESMLTGESRPVVKEPGAQVTGGSINLTGTIQVKITAIGQETMLAQITRMVEMAQTGKAPIQRLVDKVSSIFVPAVVALALLTLVGWAVATGDWERALINSIAVLVIACPCALGLATPTSIMVGTGLAAKKGILIKDAEALETTRGVTVMAFDKTGTLTEGKPRVSSVEALMPEEEFLSIVYSMQAGSNHPLAHATVDFAQVRQVASFEVNSNQVIPGKGLEAQTARGTFLFGNVALMNAHAIALGPLESLAQAKEAEGESVSFLADKLQSRLLGLISYRDNIRPESAAAIRELQAMGVKTLMISGDNEGSAARVARELGIDYWRSNVLPADKTDVIEEWIEKGEIVAMVGDGINDAPALARAHVGMAMATGTDVAMHSAGITLMRGNPELISDAIEISKLTYNKIRQNLFWAFIYNIIGLPLAMMGLLSPVIAGAAMAMSSVSVVTNSLLLKRWKG
jgi:P-type Cu+ transporter